MFVNILGKCVRGPMSFGWGKKRETYRGEVENYNDKREHDRMLIRLINGSRVGGGAV